MNDPRLSVVSGVPGRAKGREISVSMRRGYASGKGEGEERKQETGNRQQVPAPAFDVIPAEAGIHVQYVQFG
jgi:hypothetical protein